MHEQWPNHLPNEQLPEDDHSQQDAHPSPDLNESPITPEQVETGEGPSAFAQRIEIAEREIRSLQEYLEQMGCHVMIEDISPTGESQDSKKVVTFELQEGVENRLRRAIFMNPDAQATYANAVDALYAFDRLANFKESSVRFERVEGQGRLIAETYTFKSEPVYGFDWDEWEADTPFPTPDELKYHGLLGIERRLQDGVRHMHELTACIESTSDSMDTGEQAQQATQKAVQAYNEEIVKQLLGEDYRAKTEAWQQEHLDTDQRHPLELVLEHENVARRANESPGRYYQLLATDFGMNHMSESWVRAENGKIWMGGWSHEDADVARNHRGHRAEWESEPFDLNAARTWRTDVSGQEE